MMRPQHTWSQSTSPEPLRHYHRLQLWCPQKHQLYHCVHQWSVSKPSRSRASAERNWYTLQVPWKPLIWNYVSTSSGLYAWMPDGCGLSYPESRQRRWGRIASALQQTNKSSDRWCWKKPQKALAGWILRWAQLQFPTSISSTGKVSSSPESWGNGCGEPRTSSISSPWTAFSASLIWQISTQQHSC